MNINGYTLVQTCSACPEQYDVFDQEDKRVGYLRLRHGCFRADYLKCGGETLYKASPDGDGCFEDYEREYHLYKAIRAIQERANKDE